MSLLTRNRTLLAKIESVYGTDPTPTGSANAMLVKNLEVQPLSAELVSRDLIVPYLGNSDTLIAARFATINFEVEMAGSGAAGTAPAYGPLLRACGFAQSLPQITISSLTRTSGTATADCASAHGLTTGDVVTIAGATESQYNGTFTVTVTDTDSFTYPVTGSPSTPATGTPVLKTKAVYTPISTGFESVTFYFNVDGVLHKALGARGSVAFSITSRQIPVFRFSFTGLYGVASDASAPSVDFDAFQIPKVANTQNTPTVSLFSYAAVTESIEIDMANDVQYRALIGGSEFVNIVNRLPTGTIVFEAPTIASKDFWDLANDGTTGALSVVHGAVGGSKVSIACPRVSIGNPSYQDSQGVQMLSLPLTISPDSGNDELIIEVK